jgi:hypothetical protein
MARQARVSGEQADNADDELPPGQSGPNCAQALVVLREPVGLEEDPLVEEVTPRDLFGFLSAGFVPGREVVVLPEPGDGVVLSAAVLVDCCEP